MSTAYFMIICTDKRCCTCHALIHGLTRYCPNPTAVKEYFSMNGDTDINITENDYVCTTCYNHHLSIVQSAENTSIDKELKQLLSSPHTPAQWSEPYTSHITVVLNGIITRVGDVLLKNLAVLFPDVYRCSLLFKRLMELA